MPPRGAPCRGRSLGEWRKQRGRAAKLAGRSAEHRVVRQPGPRHRAAPAHAGRPTEPAPRPPQKSSPRIACRIRRRGPATIARRAHTKQANRHPGGGSGGAGASAPAAQTRHACNNRQTAASMAEASWSTTTGTGQRARRASVTPHIGMPRRPLPGRAAHSQKRTSPPHGVLCSAAHAVMRPKTQNRSPNTRTLRNRTEIGWCTAHRPTSAHDQPILLRRSTAELCRSREERSAVVRTATMLARTGRHLRDPARRPASGDATQGDTRHGSASGRSQWRVLVADVFAGSGAARVGDGRAISDEFSRGRCGILSSGLHVQRGYISEGNVIADQC